MASQKSRRNLRCFYCGRNAWLKFEKQPSFDCKHCDATNWLDEDGDITDPPASSFEEPPTTLRFVTTRASEIPVHGAASSTLGQSLSHSPFCSTCLRNQSLYTESIRQFEFPDFEYGPEYRARERSFYKWKKDLEKRYPQVCAECAPGVEEQLKKASYTAKSDHVRRMLDRTRERSVEVKRRGLLDAIDAAGRYAWHLAFAIELLWHLVVLLKLFMGWATETKVEFWGFAAVQFISDLTSGLIPSGDRLIVWAVNMTLAASPWNPRFKQSVRGFRAHILGFREWYTYQLIALLVRTVCLLIAQYNEAKELPVPIQLGAHLVIALFMLNLYKTAKKSIRTDNSPLFGPTDSSLDDHDEHQTAVSNKEGSSENLGDILDDIMKESSGHAVVSPTSSPHDHAIHRQPTNGYQQSASGTQQATDGFQRPTLGYQRVAPIYEQADPLGRQHEIQPQYHNGGTRTNLQTHNYAAPRSCYPTSGFGALGLDDQPEPIIPRNPQAQAGYYPDEMDWSPSSSQHPAFANHNPYKVKNPNPRFNNLPIVEKPGPFWYKVPPAPTNPAHKLRNPPVPPPIRESPKEKQENFFRSSNRGQVGISTAQRNEYGLTLRNPKFYATGTRNDPRDKLSRLMGSFSISPSPVQEVGAFGASFGGRPLGRQSDGKVRTVELIAILGALYLWVIALGSEEAYASTLALASACTCLIVSIRLAADIVADAQVVPGNKASLFGPSLATIGVAQIVAALVLMGRLWSTSGSAGAATCGTHGYALFGVAILHQVLHIF